MIVNMLECLLTHAPLDVGRRARSCPPGPIRRVGGAADDRTAILGCMWMSEFPFAWCCMRGVHAKARAPAAKQVRQTRTSNIMSVIEQELARLTLYSLLGAKTEDVTVAGMDLQITLAARCPLPVGGALAPSVATLRAAWLRSIRPGEYSDEHTVVRAVSSRPGPSRTHLDVYTDPAQGAACAFSGGRGGAIVDVTTARGRSSLCAVLPLARSLIRPHPAEQTADSTDGRGHRDGPQAVMYIRNHRTGSRHAWPLCSQRADARPRRSLPVPARVLFRLQSRARGHDCGCEARVGCRLRLPMVRSAALFLSPVVVGACVGSVSQAVERANVAGSPRLLELPTGRPYSRRKKTSAPLLPRSALYLAQMAEEKCRWDVAVDACSAYCLTAPARSLFQRAASSLPKRGFLIRTLRTLATRILLDPRSPLVGRLTLYMRIDPNILVLAATSLPFHPLTRTLALPLGTLPSPPACRTWIRSRAPTSHGPSCTARTTGMYQCASVARIAYTTTTPATATRTGDIAQCLWSSSTVAPRPRIPARSSCGIRAQCTYWPPPPHSARRQLAGRTAVDSERTHVKDTSPQSRRGVFLGSGMEDKGAIVDGGVAIDLCPTRSAPRPLHRSSCSLARSGSRTIGWPRTIREERDGRGFVASKPLLDPGICGSGAEYRLTRKTRSWDRSPSHRWGARDSPRTEVVSIPRPLGGLRTSRHVRVPTAGLCTMHGTRHECDWARTDRRAEEQVQQCVSTGRRTT
ncbi:hypothetical protein C8Q76DRAFT_697879 [Earliella scabrosa]|nr:hypothetical protein C8Q76DRAFT_697879 [Earliella scabrosa]